MASIRGIVPCLWFDDQAEQAARYYTGIFRNSKIGRITRYGEEGQEVTGKKPGSVLTVEFELDGHRFTALNGGPQFRFSEAISFEVLCANQAEVDSFWEKLSAGGDPAAQQCGWLKDRFGLSWQIIPEPMLELVGDPSSPRSQRAFKAMMQMKKLDLAALQRAYQG